MDQGISREQLARTARLYNYGEASHALGLASGAVVIMVIMPNRLSLSPTHPSAV